METLPFEIGETAHALRKAFDRLAVGRGVTRAQWKVLFKLTRPPGLGQVELADMLDLEPITLCRIVDRLEEGGLVERVRDPGDRRAGRLHVTARAEPAEAPKVEVRKKVAERGALRTILMLIVPALLIIGGAYYWLTSGGSVSTDDAQVKQDIVSVSPQVNGQVVEVFVRNGAHVKRGDLLFRIDPQPYQVALEQAEAQLANARLQTTQLKTQAAGTGADIVGSEANLKIKQ